MAVEFQDSNLTLSETLSEVADEIKGETITVRDLMAKVGEKGLMFFCMILTIPFLVPVSIPGVSTVFGAIIILLGIGITLNRIPWLPGPLMKREVQTAGLVDSMRKGAQLFVRLDNITRQGRMNFLTDGAAIDRLNGLALTFGGVLLIFPFGFIPFSNTFPGWAILLLVVGMLQRDGLLILLGYVLLVVTVIYFGALFVAGLAAGNSLIDLIRSGGS